MTPERAVPGNEAIMQRVNRAVASILLRKAPGQMADGQSVVFSHPHGDLVDDNDAVSLATTRIPTTEIEWDRIMFEDGSVWIGGRHGTIGYAGGNAIVLAALLSYRRRQRSEAVTAIMVSHSGR
jgi:hypothetical protein